MSNDFSYNPGMEDQRTMIEKLLVEMNMAKRWHIVEPVPGDIKDNVWLQNTEERKDARFYLPLRDLQDLHKEQVKARILDGTTKAVTRP